MAYYGEQCHIPGLKASATLASHQYKLVKLSTTAGECKVAAAATDKVVGIVQNDPAAGQEAVVAYSGISKAIASASVSAGTFLISNTTGQVADASSTDDQRVIGFALEASGTAGQIISVVLGIHNL